MKIKIETDSSVGETEVIIKCRQVSEDILELQRSLSAASTKTELVLFKGNEEFFLKPSDILFFETSDSGIDAHTANDFYKTKYKLYELEEILPRSFVRVSKSAIVNAACIYSIDKNITSSSCIKFYNTHKQIYVSRSYYKSLKDTISTL